MQTIDNLEKTHSEKLSEFMDSLTKKDYEATSQTLRDKLEWSRTVLSNKRSGKSPLTPAELIAIPIIINRNIF